MTKLLSYFGSFLVAAGLTKNYFYYKAFNIRILDYIDLSETLSIITEYSIIMLIAIPLSWFAYFMLDMKKEYIVKPDENKDLVQVAHEQRNFFKRFGLYLLRYWAASLVIFILFVMSLLMRFDIIRYEWFFETLLYTLIIIVLYVVLVLEFRYKFKKIFDKEIDYKAGAILHYGGIFVVFMAFYTYVEINEKMDGKIKVKNYTIELTTGENLSTTDELISIGQTRNYLFLYDRAKKETEIINKEFIKRITIK